MAIIRKAVTRGWVDRINYCYVSVGTVLFDKSKPAVLLCTPGVCIANRPRLIAARAGIVAPAGQRGPFGADQKVPERTVPYDNRRIEMPRQARRMSKSGYLHVIVRGIGKQVLFECNDDYRFFLSLLERYSLEASVTICAHCLMENHVHLLLLDSKGNLAVMMKKVGVSYAHYFNKKNERTGHLFQDRYLSEPVETEAYLLNVFRYILQNPQKAGICLSEEYEWSSYYDYGVRNSFVDTSMLEVLIGSWDDYEKFMRVDDPNLYMDFVHFCRDDEWAKQIIFRHLKTESGTALQKLDRSQRNKILRDLKAEGITIRQLERLTGISRGVIQKA